MMVLWAKRNLAECKEFNPHPPTRRKWSNDQFFLAFLKLKCQKIVFLHKLVFTTPIYVERPKKLNTVLVFITLKQVSNVGVHVQDSEGYDSYPQLVFLPSTHEHWNFLGGNEGNVIMIIIVSPMVLRTYDSIVATSRKLICLAPLSSFTIFLELQEMGMKKGSDLMTAVGFWKQICPSPGFKNSVLLWETQIVEDFNKKKCMSTYTLNITIMIMVTLQLWK